MKKISILLLSAFILNTVTAQTPVVLKDIYSFENQGSMGRDQEKFVTVGTTVFFAAADYLNGWELWKSDGTLAGTVLVKDIRPGYESSGPDKLTDVNGVLYFAADDGVNGVELWKSTALKKELSWSKTYDQLLIALYQII